MDPVKDITEGRGLAFLRRGGAREDFPLLRDAHAESGLVFLDSAASAQKPEIVLDTLHRFYGRQYANIHRGVYHLSQEASYGNVRYRNTQ